MALHMFVRSLGTSQFFQGRGVLTPSPLSICLTALDQIISPSTHYIHYQINWLARSTPLNVLKTNDARGLPDIRRTNAAIMMPRCGAFGVVVGRRFPNSYIAPCVYNTLKSAVTRWSPVHSSGSGSLPEAAVYKDGVYAGFFHNVTHSAPPGSFSILVSMWDKHHDPSCQTPSAMTP
ncbi:hypothetical protein SODALDRAFT_376205 [Sodiomyces alkalinus F11]|uniref:Uncharacterized protein n=1 Tax=Sodiomyces alkalinus (strain CBS 110278 / VKM F-3762 / F11) TaxID=1314773 RepID=A0A3N2Q0Y1_SODAK|nr:hypothetical protein SODALDRAFT_376205 [Sodiomyces alkalinus F11]ROT40417.1 hypothetical protein SODALDRAFT_376205 [Sodiomyces alkalinus F11]